MTETTHEPQPGAFDITPANWTPSLRDVWRFDLAASIVVALVALPLCLGVALASGAPLFAGIVTGVIGGIVVGFASGSHLMVSGPAAGLTAIVLSAIATLGSFELFLTAVVLSGVLQVILGLIRAGVIGYYFPNAVIRGMLAGIGIIIIVRQLPFTLGADAVTAAAGVLSAAAAPHPGALFVSAIALAVLLLWERPFMKRFSIVPGALVAVLACTGLNRFFAVSMPAWELDGQQLVLLPVIDSWDGLLQALSNPDWSGLTSGAVWVTALTIAVVASLETLLSLEATDRMDPLNRESPANRELLAQGLGNGLSGLLGGLPMTGVIVRSSANVYAGARTKASAILHGILLAGAVWTIPELLNSVPLAVLAVILVHTGWKLANPKQLKLFLGQGHHQWLPFVITIGAILAADLLVGIAVGMAVALFFILQEHMYASSFDVVREDETVTHIRLNSHLTFLHKANLAAALQDFSPGRRVLVDGSACKRVDHDVLDVLREFRASGPARRLEIEFTGIDLGAAAIGAGH